MSVIKKTVLEGGLRVITEQMTESESASIGIWVVTGSRNESKDEGGISHFIEHMLFKGTKRRSALDISREIESVGGVLNAFTSREYTCFYAKVLNKDLPLAIDLLSDIFLNSVFDTNEIAKEKKVVLQEIKMVEDTPDDLIHDLFAERFWADSALGRPVLGTAGSVGAITRADITGYMGRRYRPANSFVTVAGGARHSKIVNLLKPAFKRFKAAGPIAPAAPASSAPGVHVIPKDLEQAHLCIGTPVPPQSHPDRYKVYLLNTLLGGGMSSRLFQEIREKRGLAYSVYSYLNLCRDAGSLVVYAGVAREKFKEAAGLVARELSGAYRSITQAELRNAKSQLAGAMILGLEASDSRMSKLARDEIYFSRTVPVSEIMREINRVGLADAKAAARRFFDPASMTLVALGKVSRKDLPPAFSA